MFPVVLGIDTSGSWCSAALLRGPERYERRAEVGSAHSEHLLAMVGAVFDDAGLALADCDALAFAAGPGSFTGLRVGCAVAQGLAFGASLGVAPIGTLDAIAFSLHPPVASQTVLVAQDARMGEIYWSLVEQTGDVLRTIVVPSLAAPARLREALAAGPLIDLGCGNAWTMHADALSGLVPRVVVRETADAVDVAALGVVAAREGRLVPAGMASPLYVRNDVARTTAQREALVAHRAATADPLTRRVPHRS
jgi:tRNA threonylcarbamoyladenosine biosynthesis protein TsaB